MDGSWAWSGSQSQIVGAFAGFLLCNIHLHTFHDPRTHFFYCWLLYHLNAPQFIYWRVILVPNLAIMSEAFVDLHEGFSVNSFRFFGVNRKNFILCVWFPEKQLGHLLRWLFSLHSHLDSSAAPYPCHLLVVLVFWILTVLVHIYCFSLWF